MPSNDESSESAETDNTATISDQLELTDAEGPIRSISNESFNDWYNERQFRQNILEGNPYFNGPSPPKSPARHAPSTLLQCHRKTTYSRQNAPREGTTPQGLFWIGSEFEEQIIVPYLQTVIPDQSYVQNSVWIDTTVTHEGTELRFRGATGPVLVTADADPVLVTEIKTTTSLGHISEPKTHHKAQLHAYLYGLDDDYEHPITEGLLVYGSRESFNIKVFHVSFSEDFWQTVVQ